jgi:hypothetical protein
VAAAAFVLYFQSDPYAPAEGLVAQMPRWYSVFGLIEKVGLLVFVELVEMVTVPVLEVMDSVYWATPPVVIAVCATPKRTLSAVLGEPQLVMPPVIVKLLTPGVTLLR